jgi:hypothetical protein
MPIDRSLWQTLVNIAQFRRRKLINIDPFDSRFLPVETHALLRLISKVEQYTAQGRHMEARAMERAVGIVHACFTSDYQDSVTNMGEL